MQSHYPERKLHDANTRALWATEPDGNALIFIHGYGGSPLATWAEFDRLLPLSPQCSHTDVLFYSYSSIRSNVIASARLFLDFLESVFSVPGELADRTLPAAAARSREFQYRSVTIIGHSLGAVVARWALVLSHADKRPWLSKVRVVLFAPAHTGASVVKLTLAALTGMPLTLALSSAMRLMMPLASELQVDSDVLVKLRESTLAAIDAGQETLRARAVFIAEFENVVSNLPFPGDPIPVTLPGTNHFSVCKPTMGHQRPLTEVLQHI